MSRRKKGGNNDEFSNLVKLGDGRGGESMLSGSFGKLDTED